MIYTSRKAKNGICEEGKQSWQLQMIEKTRVDVID